MGPGASILLRHTFTEEQLTDLEQWLRSIVSSPLQGQRGDWYPFWIHDGQPMDLLDDCRGSCAFGLDTTGSEFYLKKTERDFLQEDGSIDEESWADLREEREQVMQHLGFIPEQNIVLYAGCNQPIDHRILGQLTLLLAERYDGIISLDGALCPPLKPDQKDHTIEEVEQYVKELSLPGRIFPIYYITLKYYGTADGLRWIYHLVDTNFLRAWLQHPQFHMIK